MSDNLSKTVHGDFDAVFCEVTQSSPVSWITQGELRLFHLNIRNNKFNPEEMKKLEILEIMCFLVPKLSILK